MLVEHAIAEFESNSVELEDSYRLDADLDINGYVEHAETEQSSSTETESSLVEGHNLLQTARKAMRLDKGETKALSLQLWVKRQAVTHSLGLIPFAVARLLSLYQAECDGRGDMRRIVFDIHSVPAELNDFASAATVESEPEPGSEDDDGDSSALVGQGKLSADDIHDFFAVLSDLYQTAMQCERVLDKEAIFQTIARHIAFAEFKPSIFLAIINDVLAHYGKRSASFYGELPALQASDICSVSTAFLEAAVESLSTESRAMFALRDRLHISNLLLVARSVYKQRTRYDLYSDLMSEGQNGLYNAIFYYRPWSGFAFSTYAMRWIEKAIAEAMPTYSNAVVIPIKSITRHRRIEAARWELKQKSAAFSREHLAMKAGCPIHAIDDIVRAGSAYVSLEAPNSVQEDMKSCIADPSSDIDQLEHERVINKVLSVAKTLGEDVFTIIKYYHGIDCERLTLDELAVTLGLSRDVVREKLRCSIVALSQKLNPQKVHGKIKLGAME